MVDGKESEPVKVGLGVPQGTVLRPLIFLHCINDLPDIVTSLTLLFAGDCLVYRVISTMEDQIAPPQKMGCSCGMG